MKLYGFLAGCALCALFDAGLAWRGKTDAGASGTGLIDQPLVGDSTFERSARIVIREKPRTKVLYSDDNGFEVQLLADPRAPIRETVLERAQAGGWIVANCCGLEADTKWLGQTMRDLGEGRLIRRVTDDAGLMSDLDLDSAEAVFEDGAGRVIRRLEFGRKDGGSSYQFVRVDGKDAFLAKHAAELVGDPLAWIDAKVLDFSPADVREAEIPFRGGAQSLVLKRSARGAPFLPAAGALPPEGSEAVDRLIGRLLESSVVLAVPRGAAAASFARDHVAARVRLILFDGRSYAIDYAAVPQTAENDPSFGGNRPGDLEFAFYRCSDPRDVAARYDAKAALVYGRGATIGQLPATAAELFRVRAP